MEAALHFRKTSPITGEGSLGFTCAGESGKCHGEEKVSVNEMCCSAITRREMRY